MTETEVQTVGNLKNARWYIENFLKIRTKAGEIIPFRLNVPQQKVYAAMAKQQREGKPVRVIVLKARQQGLTTLGAGLTFHFAATQENADTMIITHEADATAKAFEMHKLFLDLLPEALRPMVKTSSKQELRFENPTMDPAEKKRIPGMRSSIRCETAGGKGVGRSFTLRFLHASEVAWWPGSKEDTMLGLMQAIPAEPGTGVLLESTANGFDYFQQRWEDAVAGRTDFAPVFCAWWEMPSYRKAVPPGTQWSEDELREKDLYGLDEEQLAWRRWCISNNCGGDLRRFRQEYPACPEDAFLTSGECYFDADIIRRRLRELEGYQPVKRGRFEYDTVYAAELQFVTLQNIRWVDDANGAITIYREPEKGVPYILGGDTAGEGSDFFTGFVVDNSNADTVAQLWHRQSETEYTRQLYCLGRYYNDALTAPEVNFSTYPINTLQAMGYPRLYVRTSVDSYTHEAKRAYGWRTDKVSRPMMLAALKEFTEEFPEKLPSRELLAEMLSFVKNEDGRAEAQQGKHDDLVMGFAITLQLRGAQSVSREQPTGRREKWTADMWEDYRNATIAQRAMLREMWGEPM